MKRAHITQGDILQSHRYLIEAFNYRPISLTCVACKTTKRVIVKDMLFYLPAHKLNTKQQHEYLSRKSKATNLLEALSEWIFQ